MLLFAFCSVCVCGEKKVCLWDGTWIGCKSPSASPLFCFFVGGDVTLVVFVDVASLIFSFFFFGFVEVFFFLGVMCVFQ